MKWFQVSHESAVKAKDAVSASNDPNQCVAKTEKHDK